MKTPPQAAPATWGQHPEVWASEGLSFGSPRAEHAAPRVGCTPCVAGENGWSCVL